MRWGLLPVVAALLLVGCGRSVYQPVASVSRDSLLWESNGRLDELRVMIDRLSVRMDSHDSVSVRDSVVMVVKESGEVVAREVYHSVDRNHSEVALIECLKAYYDSVVAEQQSELTAIRARLNELPVAAGGELSRWDRMKMDVGGVTIVFLAAGLMVALVWLLKKIRIF